MTYDCQYTQFLLYIFYFSHSLTQFSQRRTLVIAVVDEHRCFRQHNEIADRQIHYQHVGGRLQRFTSEKNRSYRVIIVQSLFACIIGYFLILYFICRKNILCMYYIVQLITYLMYMKITSEFPKQPSTMMTVYSKPRMQCDVALGGSNLNQ